MKGPVVNPSTDPNQPQPQAQPEPVQPTVAQTQPTTVTPAVTAPEAPVVGAAQPVMPVQQPASNKKLPLIIGGAVVLILLIGGAVVAMGGKDSNSNTPTKKASSVGTIDKTPAPAAQDATTATPAKAVKPVNAVITDANIGYTITATSVVINPFPFPASQKNFGEGKVIVLVQYTVKASTKYSGSPTGGGVRLLDASGDGSSPYTANYTAEMNAGGYTPEPFSVSTGQTITGYEAYAVPVDQLSTLSLQYKQPEAKVLNGGQTIPAQTYTAKLF